MAKGDPKSPSDAALLGILFVGLGHFYLGIWWKGIALILATLLAVWFFGIRVAPVMWIISCAGHTTMLKATIGNGATLISVKK